MLDLTEHNNGLTEDTEWKGNRIATLEDELHVALVNGARLETELAASLENADKLSS